MVEESAEVGISKKAVKAKPGEVIKASKKLEQEVIELELIKDVFPTTSTTPTPASSVKNVILTLKESGAFPPITDEIRKVIINIETTGFDPLKHRIIAIGIQNADKLEDPPTVILLDSESAMISSMMNFISKGKFTDVIGYAFSFDLKFVVIRAMKLGISVKQFSDMKIIDVMQLVTQVKEQFVYKPQRNPKLSDLADFLFSFPKPFSDIEMIKFWASGEFQKVIQFTSEQITRILLVWLTFRQTTENSFSQSALVGSSTSSSSDTPLSNTKLSIASIPKADNSNHIIVDGKKIDIL